MPRTFRAIQFGLVVLTLVLVGSVATAEAKSKIAVLGLEAAVGANGQIDPADTQFAKDLTKELRNRANLSATYEPTKDQRELADEKLMNNCGSEHPSCMAPIGASMGAEVMLVGKIENAKEKGVDGWRVSLKLISVAKKQQIGQLPNEFISRADAKSALAAWVKTAFRKVTGEASDGILVIKVAGATSGSVIVNNETKDTLKSGQATLSLPEGRYKIGVDADGFKLWEKEGVTISADKPVELSPELVKAKGPSENTNNDTNTKPLTEPNQPTQREGTVSHGSKKTIFKVAAAVGLGGAAVTGTIWGIKYFGTIKSFGDDKLAGTYTVDNMDRTTVSSSDCGKNVAFSEQSSKDKFDDACSAKDLVNHVLIPTTIGLGIVGGAALVYILVSKDDSSGEHAMGRQRKHRNLVVTPVITPDGTGATLRFDW